MAAHYGEGWVRRSGAGPKPGAMPRQQPRCPHIRETMDRGANREYPYPSPRCSHPADPAALSTPAPRNPTPPTPARFRLRWKASRHVLNDGGSATLNGASNPPVVKSVFPAHCFGSADLRWDTGRAELITAKEQYQARSQQLARYPTGFGYRYPPCNTGARGGPGLARGEASYDDPELPAEPRTPAGPSH